MIISAIALLLSAPVLATSPIQGQIAMPAVTSGASEAAHQADGSAAAANGGLSVRKICNTGGPSMFSGRARRENCELKVVQPQCRSTAPSMFSGRARTSDCVVEMTEPNVPSYAPAIFSGRAPKPASAYAPPQYTYTVAADGTATPQVTYQTVQEARKAYVPRRLPSMFTGRRQKPRAAQ
ncbi:MAG: hypothetical protein ABIM50_05915 [Novosphingobium sp.]